MIERFINNFYGYGNLKAPHWFIGMEEGGGDSLQEIEQRIETWHKRGQKITEDLVDYHKAIGISIYFDESPKLQSTWKKLIRVLHVLEGKPLTTEAIKQTQKASFGRSNGSSCLIELLPLPSPSISDWLYGEYSSLAYLQTRKAYRQQVIPDRIEKIQRLIQQYHPQTVMFYGLDYHEYWQSISGSELEEIYIDQFRTYVGRYSHTKFIVTQHPASRGITNTYFEQVGQNFISL